MKEIEDIKTALEHIEKNLTKETFEWPKPIEAKESELVRYKEYEFIEYVGDYRISAYFDCGENNYIRHAHIDVQKKFKVTAYSSAYWGFGTIILNDGRFPDSPADIVKRAAEMLMGLNAKVGSKG